MSLSRKFSHRAQNDHHNDPMGDTTDKTTNTNSVDGANNRKNKMTKRTLWRNAASSLFRWQTRWDKTHNRKHEKTTREWANGKLIVCRWQWWMPNNSQLCWLSFSSKQMTTANNAKTMSEQMKNWLFADGNNGCQTTHNFHSFFWTGDNNGGKQLKEFPGVLTVDVNNKYKEFVNTCSYMWTHTGSQDSPWKIIC